MFADIAIDPGRIGCQSFEATDFLVRRNKHDDTSPQILWRIGVGGVIAHSMSKINRGRNVLTDRVQESYAGSGVVRN